MQTEIILQMKELYEMNKQTEHSIERTEISYLHNSKNLISCNAERISADFENESEYKDERIVYK
jgi:hypothetical protein